MTKNIPITDLPLQELIHLYPFVKDFFISNGMTSLDESLSIQDTVNRYDLSFFEEKGLSRQIMIDDFISYIETISEYNPDHHGDVRSLCIIGGYDKKRVKENIRLDLTPGEIYCIVGPTGSGKSRLLADIECLAQGDTPTGRTILLNDEIPSFEIRFASDHKLVAQLSQNMNFVMDMAAGEFIAMHAESRMVKDISSIVSAVLKCANDLAGEEFNSDTPLTQLSGGQSRSLMIADTALLSSSPIVLIDEIENAGVDRKKALDLLVKKEKIVLLSTHDPILAMMGDARIVIRNGGIVNVIRAKDKEEKNLSVLRHIDKQISEIRNRIRSGDIIDFDISFILEEETKP